MGPKSKKIIVGLIFGGKSPEHEVSIMSAKGIIDNIDRKKFAVVEIGIDKHGNFWTAENFLKQISQGVVDAVTVEQVGAKQFDFFVDGKNVDVFFPILHGAGGEDGEIQGLIRSVNKKFVGADILASAVCLDKGIFKSLLRAKNIPQTKFEILDFNKMSAEVINEQLSNVKNAFCFPIFVKPCNLGSSVGIVKVKDARQLGAAVEHARTFDNRIIIEESIEGAREIEVSVLGNKYDDTRVSLPGEIIPGAEFYDYDDKYKSDKSKTVAPADLSEEVILRIQKLARETYDLVCCHGFARVDFLVDPQGNIFLNEINTIPGFTQISMYPKMWEASGLKYQNLITKLIELALSR
ncbi:MAG: D-alanine--D-alanine ligase family protein [Candidatus Falkowbacteria bacterium]